MQSTKVKFRKRMIIWKYWKSHPNSYCMGYPIWFLPKWAHKTAFKRCFNGVITAFILFRSLTKFPANCLQMSRYFANIAYIVVHELAIKWFGFILYTNNQQYAQLFIHESFINLIPPRGYYFFFLSPFLIIPETLSTGR